MAQVTGKPCRVPHQHLRMHATQPEKQGAAGNALQEEVRCISRYEERTVLHHGEATTPAWAHGEATTPAWAEHTALPGTHMQEEDPNWYPLSPKPALKELKPMPDTSHVPAAGHIHPSERLEDAHAWMGKKDRINRSARMRDFHMNPGVCAGVAGEGAAGRISDERRTDTPGGWNAGVGRWRSLTPDYHNRYAANLAGSSLPGVGPAGTFGEWTPPPTDMAGLAPEKSTHGRTGWSNHETGFAATRRTCEYDPRVANLSESTEMKDFCRYHKEEKLEKAKWQKGYSKAGMVMSSKSAGDLRDMSILRSAAGLRMGNSISHLYGT